MKINCLSCGHKMDLDEAYSDYDGQIKCFICAAVLRVRTEEGRLKSVKIVSSTRPSVEHAVEPTE